MRVDEKARVEAPVVRRADALGVLHNKNTLQGRRGFPDRTFWLPGGRPLLMEAKSPGEAPDPLQEATIARLTKLGYEVHVYDSKEEGIRILEEAVARALLARAVEAAQGPARRR